MTYCLAGIDDNIIPVIAIVGGLLIAMIAILSGAILKITAVRSAERTRREIAAYVAEGSIDPDKAIAMLNAGRSDEEIRIHGSAKTV